MPFIKYEFVHENQSDTLLLQIGSAIAIAIAIARAIVSLPRPARQTQQLRESNTHDHEKSRRGPERLRHKYCAFEEDLFSKETSSGRRCGQAIIVRAGQGRAGPGRAAGEEKGRCVLGLESCRKAR